MKSILHMHRSTVTEFHYISELLVFDQTFFIITPQQVSVEC